MLRNVSFAAVTSLLMVGLGGESGILAVPIRPRVALSLVGFWVAFPGDKYGQHEGASSASLTLLWWTCPCLQAHGRVSDGEPVPC